MLSHNLEPLAFASLGKVGQNYIQDLLEPFFVTMDTFWQQVYAAAGGHSFLVDRLDHPVDRDIL
jgi:hypothetical protein